MTRTETDTEHTYKITLNIHKNGNGAADSGTTPITRYAYFQTRNEAAKFLALLTQLAEDGQYYEFARLPAAPKNASPIPSLTSLYTNHVRGDYGSSRFRGNCSGNLIKDILRFYNPSTILDPMTGSGTCGDVARELGIPCNSFDLTSGFDITDRQNVSELGLHDFVWLHPPYWDMIRYSDHPKCLSNADSLESFLSALENVVRNCLSVLSENGKLAILIGSYYRKGHHLSLPFHTLNVAAKIGLELAAPEIVRFSHDTSSSRRTYRTSFIPNLHDVCLIFKRAA